MTAFVEGGGVRLAAVPEGSPLLEPARTRALLPDGRPAADVPEEGRRAKIFPLAGSPTLGVAARALQTGSLECDAPVSVAWARLRSPADRRALDEPFRLPVLAPIKGVIDPGSEDERTLSRVFDLATVKTAASARPPVQAKAASLVRVEGGTTLFVPLFSAVLSSKAIPPAYGPIVRLAPDARHALPSTPAMQAVGTGTAGETISASRRVPAPASTDGLPRDVDQGGGSLFLSRSTKVRLALDDRTGELRPGDRIRAGGEGFGMIDRPVAESLVPPVRPADVEERFLVAHGAALGLPVLSIGLSLTNARPSCVALCSGSNQPLPWDSGYLSALLERSRASIADADRDLRLVEAGAIGFELLTVLIPSARRGVVSRFEVFEDAMIIGEGMMFGVATPLWLQRRLGRARPKMFHPDVAPGLTGRDAVGAPLFALNTTIVASGFGAAATLLMLEDAGAGWIVPTSLALGGLTAGVAFLEVHAGVVFPSDLPLGIASGLLAGSATAFWHSVFWRGWPGDTSRGELPLRLQAIGLQPMQGGGGHLFVRLEL